MEKKDIESVGESNSQETEDHKASEGLDRRGAFQVAGKMALYTAPAMLALLVAKKAHAGSE